MDAGRARRLAGTAGETAVEMKLRRCRRRSAFEHLFDQVNAPAWTVELVTEQLIRRARGQAKAAMNAGAENRISLATLRRIANERRKIRLHQKSA